MRVLHVTATNGRRGAESFALGLSDALRDLGMDGEVRSVISVHDEERLPIPPLATHRSSAGGLLRLRRLLHDVDVAVGHGSSSLAALALASARTGTPFVYRSIGDPLQWSHTPARRWRTGQLISRATAVTALWDGAATALTESLGVPATRIRVIPNGVAANRFPMVTPAVRAEARTGLGLPQDALVVAFVGELSEEKRPDVAIDVAARTPDVTLLMVGSGPLRGPIESLATERIPGRARFLGRIPDVRSVYAASDALLLTSDTEGQPAVLMESALCGCPAVATSVGGVPGVIIDGTTGVLAPPGDISALADGLSRVLAGRSAMGAAARDHCLVTFELSAIARQWDDLLRDVVAGRVTR